MDTEAFVEQYMKALAPYVAEVIPPDQLIPLLWDATRRMIENTDPTRTNEEVFTQHFLDRSGLEKEAIWPLFERFYAEHFPTLKQYVEPGTRGREVVQAALDQGYRIAVATNPVFPESAIRERMRWAEVEDLVEWVSVYEETHHCKPQPGYYREVAERMEVSPQECLMVGNDVQEDMVAKTVGMKTYLVTDWLIDRGHPSYEPDQQGTLEQLLQDVRERRGLFST